jgi:flagellar motor switch protein FliG
VDIQDNMFEFEDFVKLDRRSMQTLGQALDQDELMLAFRGAPQQLVDYFLENVSERQALVMKDDMEVATPKPLTEVLAAQKNIVRQARKLQEAGEIIMSAGDSTDYV